MSSHLGRDTEQQGVVSQLRELGREKSEREREKTLSWVNAVTRKYSQHRLREMEREREREELEEMKST